MKDCEELSSKSIELIKTFTTTQLKYSYAILNVFQNSV